MGLPYFPMYPTDFEAKTSHLTLEEDGAYNRLLRLMWMTPGCSLPDDDAWIMRRMRVDADTFERVVRVVIDEFCERENGRLSNAKLSRVFSASNEAHKKRVSAGAKGGKSKALKTNDSAASNAKAMLKQPEPKPELKKKKEKDAGKPAGVCFDAFWKDWPNKTAKAAAQKAWSRLSPEHRAEAAAMAPAWFQKWRECNPQASPIHPATYLNAKRWQDEFPQSPTALSQQPRAQAAMDKWLKIAGDR